MTCTETFPLNQQKEELRGESDAITFKNLAAGQKVKQFKNFLRNGDNKTSLIRFVVEHWQKTPGRKRLEDKELYVTWKTDATRSLPRE